MLRFLRKYSGSTGVKALYAVLALLFVIWGVGAVGGQRVDVVARVHGQAITRNEVERATAAMQRRYEAMFKGKMALPANLDLRSRALDELIDDALLRHEAQRLGLGVTEGELDAAIMAMPELQENGHFNRDILERALSGLRDRGEFEDQVRRGIIAERLQSTVTDGVQVSDGEIEERYRLDHEQVNLAFIRVAAADLGKSATLTDDDLQKYLTDHPDRYRVPERLRARYVAYPVSAFMEQVQVGDQEITDYYNLHRDDRFTEPEQVRARHILVNVAAGDDAKAAARKKAEGLLAKVKAGADFADLATKNSDDSGSASKGGDLGLFGRGKMVQPFEAAAFALGVGQVSDIVESPFGFHIIKVEEHRKGGPKPLEEVREEIVTALEKTGALDLARAQAEADRAKVVGGKTLADAVGDRPIKETPPFGTSDAIPEVGHVKAFNDAAFALADGEVSDTVESDDAVYLLAPFDHAAAHLPALADVHDRVAADARRERGEALARERAEALRGRAKEVGLAQAATEASATVDETGAFDRRTVALPKLGNVADLRNDAFALTTEAPVASKVYTAMGDAVVVALKARTPADMAGLDADKDRIRDSLLQQKRGTVLTQFMNGLKERAQREGALEVRSDALGRS
jgi:peptidyl-prolyl cis-trans isomerase D